MSMQKEYTKQDLKNSLKEWMISHDDQSLEKKTEELKNKFDQLLRDSIEQERINTHTQILNEKEIVSAMNYIIVETYKDEKLKRSSSDNINTMSADSDNFGIQYADAVCPATTNPTYRQVEIDIDGGTYGDYTFEGDNDLYRVATSMNNTTCEKTYTLYWHDEDHPYLDDVYDGLRQAWFGRTYDVETFVIKNNNTIEFDTTWSDDNDYDCLDWDFAGCHETTKKSYSGGTVYVANTWNHMMDTFDTNTSLSKVAVP